MDPEGGLATGAPAIVLGFEKPVGFPHETQNLAFSESEAPQYRQAGNRTPRFPFSDRLFESKLFTGLTPLRSEEARLAAQVDARDEKLATVEGRDSIAPGVK